MTETLAFTAPCDGCGRDARWEEHNVDGLLKRIVIVCDFCGDSDPQRKMIAAIEGGVS